MSSSSSVLESVILKRALGTIRLTADALDRNSLSAQDLVLQRVHGGRGLVDMPYEGDRPLQNRLQAIAILDSRLRVLVFDDERRPHDVERQQLTRGQLMVEPVHATVLQVRQ